MSDACLDQSTFAGIAGLPSGSGSRMGHGGHAETEGGSSGGGGGKTKRKKRRHRTIFTQFQIDELEKAFQVHLKKGSRVLQSALMPYNLFLALRVPLAP